VPHRSRRITLPSQEEIIYHLWQDGIPFTPQYPDALEQGQSAFSSNLWQEDKGRTKGTTGLTKSSTWCAIFDASVIGASHRSKRRSFHYFPNTQSAGPIGDYLQKSAHTGHSLPYTRPRHMTESYVSSQFQPALSNTVPRHSYYSSANNEIGDTPLGTNERKPRYIVDRDHFPHFFESYRSSLKPNELPDTPKSPEHHHDGFEQV
jgi:hypothetical protein